MLTYTPNDLRQAIDYQHRQQQRSMTILLITVLSNNNVGCYSGKNNTPCLLSWLTNYLFLIKYTPSETLLFNRSFCMNYKCQNETFYK